jgi:hypothetical protein
MIGACREQQWQMWDRHTLEATERTNTLAEMNPRKHDSKLRLLLGKMVTTASPLAHATITALQLLFQSITLFDIVHTMCAPLYCSLLEHATCGDYRPTLVRYIHCVRLSASQAGWERLINFPTRP